MRIRKYRLLVATDQIEAMWKFGRNNQTNFYCITTAKEFSVFETYTTSETYMMLKVAIPLRELTDNEYT
jgi:hypothetical protein